MKTNSKVYVILIVVIALAITACKKDEAPAKPTISLLELGNSNSKTGTIGEDLHVEAYIEAEGRINTIRLRIHPEDSATWTLDTTFTAFSGLKNLTFHEDILIPLSAQAGNYHFDLEVLDEEGYQAVAESELHLIL